MEVLIAVVVILFLYVCWIEKDSLSTWFKKPTEKYGPCYNQPCDNYKMPRNGSPVLNPFIWPYSGTQNVDDLYILNKDSGTDFNFECGPLTQLSAPDHVILTN